MTRSIVALSIFCAVTAQAGSITFSGAGEAHAPADFLSVVITVQSRCYTKASESREANAKLANELLATMRTYVPADAETRLGEKPITAIPGEIVRRQETYYDEETRRQQTLCEGWAASNVITLRLLDKEKLPEVLDKSFDIVDKNVLTPTSKDPQTWATYSGTTPELFTATREKLRVAAIDKAVARAKSDLEVISKACGLTNQTITQIAVNDYNPPVAFRGRAAMESAADAGGSVSSETPAEFGLVTVSVSVNFTVSYEGGRTFCTEPAKP